MSHQRHNETPARTTEAQDDSLLDQLADMDDQSIIQDAHILSTKNLRESNLATATPALPQRSTLRTSKFLDNLRLDSIKSATDSISTPHDVYLSSEEDASSSADDFSAEEMDLDEDDDDDLLESPASTSSSPVSEKSLSREVTARVVSVVFVGRPSIVELSPKSKTFSAPPALQRPQIPLRSPSRASFAPRHSSLIKARPSFLNTDPCASNQFQNERTIDEDSMDSTVTPKTPTAVLSRFQKSLSLVRKRSRANLKDSPRDNLSSLHTRNGSMMTLSNFFTHSPEESSPEPDAAPAPNTLTKTHTRSKTQTVPLAPIAPASPAPAKRGLLSGLKKQRRSSLKI
ncbi:hypothetical protein Micbo1qcDRAFT_160814 [Microdochium bolleyi]|uniref:Uncharacterized protein n=1 Tax=Microdochium bolleyi TaxID=196109 RepID=A0A136J713_9PEZI|nr:hypothetical protein Micbo1qcDRAFT_160814 [Microdochium bolleyi]